MHFCCYLSFETSLFFFRYEAGDHVGIFPTNDAALVQRLATLLDVDLGQEFKLVNLDEECNKRHPFPCPTTYGTALAHYVDVVAPVDCAFIRLIGVCSV